MWMTNWWKLHPRGARRGQCGHPLLQKIKETALVQGASHNHTMLEQKASKPGWRPDRHLHASWLETHMVSISFGLCFFCIAPVLNKQSGGVLNRCMQWVYSGAVSRGGQTLAVRMVLVGERRGLGRRGTQEEGHGSSLSRNDGEVPFGRSCRAKLNA